MTTEDAVAAVCRLGWTLAGDRCCPTCWGVMRSEVRAGCLWYVCPACHHEAPA